MIVAKVTHHPTTRFIFLPNLLVKVRMVMLTNTPAKNNAPKRLVLIGSTQNMSMSVTQFRRDLSKLKSGNAPSMRVPSAHGPIIQNKSKLMFEELFRGFGRLTYVPSFVLTKPISTVLFRTHHDWDKSEVAQVINKNAIWNKTECSKGAVEPLVSTKSSSHLNCLVNVAVTRDVQMMFSLRVLVMF